MARFLTKVVDELSDELVGVVALTMLGAGIVIAVVVSRLRARETERVLGAGRAAASELQARINSSSPRTSMVH